MINSISSTLFNGILDFVTKIIEIILIPIDSLISSSSPDLSNYLIAISDFFNYLLTATGWVIDCFMIPTEVINIICVYLVFKLTTSLSVYTVKFALKWYRALKS